ncbi:hypothetical protein BH10ACT1_BH10ACT1_03970 [soil metagenome]
MVMADEVAAARPVTPVSILAELLGEVSEHLDLCELDADVRRKLRRATALAAGLDPYLARCTTPESPALAALAARTAATDWSRPDGDGAAPVLEQEMLSGHVEGQVLRFLVGLTRAHRVLEIGMFTGYSALAMAEALPDGGVVVACELDAEVAAFARECFDASPAGDRIQVRVGPASDSLAQLTADGESFDLVFIDADKGGYIDYFRTLLDTDLLAPDGLICVDNTLMQGHPYATGATSANGDAIAAFNRAVVDDPRVEQVLLPLRDGLTLIRRV